MSWNYAELSKQVSKSGGPEKFVHSIREKSYLNGYKAGSRRGAIIGIASSVVSGLVLLYEEGPKVCKWVRSWNKKDKHEEEPDKELISGI